MRLISDISPRVQDSLVALGSRIKRARKQKKLTLIMMEAQCGIHRATLGRLEHGDKGVGIGTLFVVLDALGLPGEVDRLIQESPLPNIK